MKFHTKCPHCAKRILFDVNVEPGSDTRMGPEPYNPGPEIDKFVIKAVERQRLSLSAIALMLEERKIPNGRGRSRWYAASVKRLYEHAVEREEKAESETP